MLLSSRPCRAGETSGARLLLANDPDADRLAVAERRDDGGWRMFTGNEIGILLADWLWKNTCARSPEVRKCSRNVWAWHVIRWRSKELWPEHIDGHETVGLNWV